MTFVLLIYLSISICRPVNGPHGGYRRLSFNSGSSSPISPHSPGSPSGRGSTNKAKSLLKKATSSVRSGAQRFAAGARKLGHELSHGDANYTPHQVIGEGEGRYHVNAQYN